MFIKISIENIYYPIGNSYLTLHAYTIYFKDTNKKNRDNSVVQWTACCVLCWDARITLQRSLIFTSIIKFKNNDSPTRLALSTGNTWETYN